jgi:opine dehydrogenase
MRFAVLGMGPGAQTYAATLCAAGHRVSIWSPGWSDTEHTKLQAIQKDGIRTTGALEVHVRPDLATKDMGAAVASAEIVVVVTQARAHRTIATQLAPLLRKEQRILLSPGRTGGAFEVSAIVGARGASCAGIAETASLPFTCRLRGPNDVLVADRKREVGVAALPRASAEAIVAALRGAVPLAARRTVLETSFENLGPVFHVVGMLFSAAQVERSGLEVYYRDAVTPAVARAMEAVDAERLRIAAAFGVRVPSALELSSARYASDERSLYAAIKANAAYMAIGGVDGLAHRYLSDDLPASVAPIVGLAGAAGVAAPLHEALLILGSALCGEDYAATGRTLATMGLSGMDAAAIGRMAAS